MLFYFTYEFLEISSGILWWATSKSVKLLYNGVLYLFSKDDIINDSVNIEDNYDSLTIEEIKGLKKEIQELKKMINKNN